MDKTTEPNVGSRRGWRRIGSALAKGILGLMVAFVAFVAIDFLTESCACDDTPPGQQGLAAIQEGVRSLHAGSESYTGVSPAMLIDAKAVPSNMIATCPRGACLRHYWKGPVEVSATPDGRHFVVAYLDLPMDVCVKMASGNSSTPGNGLAAVTINGQFITLPVTPSAAVEACRLAESNQVVWTFE